MSFVEDYSARRLTVCLSWRVGNSDLWSEGDWMLKGSCYKWYGDGRNVCYKVCLRMLWYGEQQFVSSDLTI